MNMQTSVTVLLLTEQVLYVIPLTCRALQAKCLTGGSHGIPVGSDLRYKNLGSEDHYFARAYPASYVVDPNVPMNQKTWDVDHYIMEDVGPGPEFLQLCFKRPADLGYDERASWYRKTVNLWSVQLKSSCAAVMTHKWHP